MINAVFHELPLYQVWFWSFGVAFFSLGIVVNAVIWQRKSTVKNKLAIKSISLLEGPLVNKTDIGLRFAFNIRSYADREVYFEIKRISLIVEGRAPTRYDLPDMIVILQAQAEETVSGPFINKIEKKSVLNGILDMTIIYGPKEDNLCFEWSYNGEIGILFGPPKNGEVKVWMQLAHNSIEHKRAAA